MNITEMDIQMQKRISSKSTQKSKVDIWKQILTDFNLYEVGKFEVAEVFPCYGGNL